MDMDVLAGKKYPNYNSLLHIGRTRSRMAIEFIFPALDPSSLFTLLHRVLRLVRIIRFFSPIRVHHSKCTDEFHSLVFLLLSIMFLCEIQVSVHILQWRPVQEKMNTDGVEQWLSGKGTGFRIRGN